MATKRKAAKKTRRAPKQAATKRGGSPTTTAHRAVAITADARRPAKERTAAAAASPLAVCESEKDFQAMLKVLRDADEPVKVRLAALQALQAASFSVLAFEGCRGDYIATLRQIAEDRDPELRQRVLGLVMREKALQLLGNDVHADAYEMARAIVRKPPNEAARREALRLLAADATAAPLFEKLLLDKDELREIRQIAASALYALQPDRMQKHARDILLDKSDYDDIKATSLSALTQLDDKTLSDDKALMRSVDRFSTGKTPLKYKQTARQFLSKYGR